MATNYNTTSHSKYLLQCHLVFSTKYRKKILTGALSDDLKQIMYDIANEIFGWKLRHAMNGGEKRILCYFLDAFDEARNIVIEYDEPHHYTWDGKLRPYDIIRMNDIISHLGCTFMRYNEKTGELKSYGKNYEIISD